MIQLHNGPAGGVSLELARTPMFLRVVVNAEGSFDALDQLDDTPRENETVFVYLIKDGPTQCHVDYMENGRRASKWTLIAEYDYYETPETFAFRDNELWREWTIAEHSKLKQEAPV